MKKPTYKLRVLTGAGFWAMVFIAIAALVLSIVLDGCGSSETTKETTTQTTTVIENKPVKVEPPAIFVIAPAKVDSGYVAPGTIITSSFETKQGKGKIRVTRKDSTSSVTFEADIKPSAVDTSIVTSNIVTNRTESAETQVHKGFNILEALGIGIAAMLVLCGFLFLLRSKLGFLSSLFEKLK